MITINQEKRSIDGKCIIPAQTSAMQQCDEEASREEEDFGGDVYAVHPPLNPSQGLDTRDSIQKTTNHDGCEMTKNTNKTIDSTLLQTHHSSEILHPYWMPGIKDDRSIPVPTVHSRISSCLKIPPELNCPMCKKIMKDAVRMAKCCFYSYCRECITKHLNSHKWTCLCGEVNISVERDLVLNKTLQQTIQRYAQITNSPQPSDGGLHNSISNVTSINSECSDSQIIKKRKVCPRPGYVCYRCHIPGHLIHNCPTLLNDRPDFAVKSFKRRVAELY